MTKLKAILQNGVVQRVLRDARCRAAAITAMVQSTLEQREIVVGESESAAFNQAAAMPPIERFTCPLMADGIKDIIISVQLRSSEQGVITVADDSP